MVSLSIYKSLDIVELFSTCIHCSTDCHCYSEYTKGDNGMPWNVTASYYQSKSRSAKHLFCLIF